MTPPVGARVPSAAKVRALVVLAATVAIVLLALVADLLAEPGASGPPQPVAQGSAKAGAWYCPATARQEEAAMLSVAAVGQEASRVTVVRYPEGQPVADEPVGVAPGDAHQVRLEPGQASRPVAVRWEGGPAVAVWRIEADDAPAAPCEPGPAEAWHVAGLDTAGGSTSTLHLTNPFAIDAVARVTFATPEGRVRLLLTDNVFVAAGETVRLDVGEFQPEQPDLAATVEVLTGRLVAQGELVPGSGSGTAGRALIPAAREAGTEWSFAYARADDMSSSWLSVANAGEREAAVEVRASSPAPDAAVQEYSVPAGGVRRIDLGEVSEEPEFGVDAVSVNEVPIVVHRVTSLRSESRQGLAVSRGGQPATHWALVGGGAGERRGRINVYNPGAETVTVDLVTSGEDPPEWRGVEIPANGWLTRHLTDVDHERSAIPLRVEASGPVVAELRSHHQSGALRLWTAVGAPSPVWTGPPSRPPLRRNPLLSTTPVPEADTSPSPAPAEPGELRDVPEVPDPEGSASS